jgi:hypothetical protein
MLRSSILVLLVLATATGCWTDACVSGPLEPSGGLCTEFLSGIFDDHDPGTVCSGEEYFMKTCPELGYSYECAGRWYRPAAALTCRTSL